MKLRDVIILTIFSLVFGCSKKESSFHDLIGLEINSTEIQRFLNRFEDNPEINKYSDAYYYSYKSKGVGLRFSNNDTLTAIFLYSEASDNFRQYQGDIPYNLQFTDTRKNVEEKLGPPDTNGGGGVINFYSIWDNKGVSIFYKTLDQEDMKNKIHHITISLKQ
jgi:hypothetical protein